MCECVCVCRGKEGGRGERGRREGRRERGMEEGGREEGKGMGGWKEAPPLDIVLRRKYTHTAQTLRLHTCTASHMPQQEDNNVLHVDALEPSLSKTPTQMQFLCTSVLY